MPIFNFDIPLTVIKRFLALLAFIGAGSTLHAYQPDITLDAHSDSSAVELSPSSAWADDTSVTEAFRGNAKYISSTTANTSQFARFHTTLPQSGPWKVFVWNNGRAGFGNSVNVKVTHAEATPSTAAFNQSSNGGQWFLAGVFWFDASKEAEVKIEHNTSGMLSADAVRFSFAEAAIEIDSSLAPVGGMTYTPSSASWPSQVDKSGNGQTVRRSTTANSTATFTPELPAPGEYEVSLWMPARNGAWLIGAGAAPSSISVEVHHRTGVASIDVPIPIGNQHEGQWVQVGTTPYLFDATPITGPNPNKLVVKCNGSPTPADAVRFSKVGAFGVYLDNGAVSLQPVVWSPLTEWVVNYVTNRTAQRWTNFKFIPYGPSALRAEANSTTRQATYTPNLPELGLYDVYVWYPYQNTNAHQTLIELNAWTQDSQGNPFVGSVSRTIEQEHDGGMWTHIGRHILSPSNDSVVANRPHLTISTNGESAANYSYADGVLFLRDNEEIDLDQDGLADWHERVIGTNTNTSDLNGDGIADGWDTDGDHIPDGWEYQFALNPLDLEDAVDDPDGDGLSNFQEYQQGSNPKNYYNGKIPVLTVLSAQDFALPGGEYFELVVKVQIPSANLLIDANNAPLSFGITQGDGALVTQYGSGSGVATISRRANAEGVVSIFFQKGSGAAQTKIDAVASSDAASVTKTFTVTLMAGIIRNFVYDEIGRLKTATQGTGTTTFTYDANGNIESIQ